MPALQAMLSRQVDDDHQGQLQGSLAALTSLTSIIGPLIVTAMSVVVLGETVGPRRWGAVVVGMLGVLVLVRPFQGEVEPAAFLVLISAFCYASSHMMTRRMRLTESAMTLNFFVQCGFILVSLSFGLFAGDGHLAQAPGSTWEFLFRPWHVPPVGAVLRTLESDRFVTGVSWVDGELWHGTWEGDDSDLRRIDPDDGRVLERLELPAGVHVSGLESDGADLFYCGGGPSGLLRAVRRSVRRRERNRRRSAACRRTASGSSPGPSADRPC